MGNYTRDLASWKKIDDVISTSIILIVGADCTLRELNLWRMFSRMNETHRIILKRESGDLKYYSVETK